MNRTNFHNWVIVPVSWFCVLAITLGTVAAITIGMVGLTVFALRFWGVNI